MMYLNQKSFNQTSTTNDLSNSVSSNSSSNALNRVNSSTCSSLTEFKNTLSNTSNLLLTHQAQPQLIATSTIGAQLFNQSALVQSSTNLSNLQAQQQQQQQQQQTSIRSNSTSSSLSTSSSSSSPTISSNQLPSINLTPSTSTTTSTGFYPTAPQLTNMYPAFNSGYTAYFAPTATSTAPNYASFHSTALPTNHLLSAVNLNSNFLSNGHHHHHHSSQAFNEKLNQGIYLKNTSSASAIPSSSTTPYVHSAYGLLTTNSSATTTTPLSTLTSSLDLNNYLLKNSTLNRIYNHATPLSSSAYLTSSVPSSKANTGGSSVHLPREYTSSSSYILTTDLNALPLKTITQTFKNPLHNQHSSFMLNGVSNGAILKRKKKRCKKPPEMRNILPKNSLMLLHELRPSAEYRFVCQSGPIHRPIFTMCVDINEHKFEGVGKTKKEARMKAAERAVEFLLAHPEYVVQKVSKQTDGDSPQPEAVAPTCTSNTDEKNKQEESECMASETEEGEGEDDNDENEEQQRLDDDQLHIQSQSNELKGKEEPVENDNSNQHSSNGASGFLDQIEQAEQSAEENLKVLENVQANN